MQKSFLLLKKLKNTESAQLWRQEYQAAKQRGSHMRRWCEGKKIDGLEN